MKTKAFTENDAIKQALSILESFQESGDYDDYKSADGFTDEQYGDMLAHLRRMTNDQTASMTAIITEQNSEADDLEIEVKVACQSGQLYVYPRGYGENGGADGFGSPFFLDIWDGELRAVICTDINSQDPQIISLEGSREDKRDD
jgi:hypothetical protein